MQRSRRYLRQNVLRSYLQTNREYDTYYIGTYIFYHFVSIHIIYIYSPSGDGESDRGRRCDNNTISAIYLYEHIIYIIV